MIVFYQLFDLPSDLFFFYFFNPTFHPTLLPNMKNKVS